MEFQNFAPPDRTYVDLRRVASSKPELHSDSNRMNESRCRRLIFCYRHPAGTFEIFPMRLQTSLNPSNRPVSRPFQLANANTISSWDYSKLSREIRSNSIFSFAYFSLAY